MPVSPSSFGFNPLPQSVRVESDLRLSVIAGPSRGKISERRETGALRFRFPTAHGRPPEAILVNVAGGLTGGDRVSMDIAVDARAALTLTTATAERVYRSHDDPTMITTTLRLGQDAALVWLPQEAILHEGARLVRRIDVQADASAHFLIGDMVYLGRRASGERFDDGMWKDRWRVSIGGQLVFADETQITQAALADQFRAGTLGGAVALGAMLVRGSNSQQILTSVYECLADIDGVDGGASMLDGLVCVRLMTNDAAKLRSSVMAVSEAVLPMIDMPMPRALMS